VTLTGAQRTLERDYSDADKGLRERWKETTVTLTGAQRTLERDYSDADKGLRERLQGA
jgi:L-asparaginase/Glu-tRNA(Gln) amidotransferase subunit D